LKFAQFRQFTPNQK